MITTALDILAYMERIPAGAAVQVRGGSGAPLGVAVVVDGRVCFARAHPTEDLDAKGPPPAWRATVRRIVELARAHGSLAAAFASVSAEEVQALAPSLRAYVSGELWAMATRAGGARLRSRWRPLLGDLDPRLSFSVRELFVDLVDLAGLARPHARPSAAMTVFSDERLTSGFPVPVDIRGFEGAPLRSLLTTARACHQLMIAARGLPAEPVVEVQLLLETHALRLRGEPASFEVLHHEVEVSRGADLPTAAEAQP